MTLKTCLALFVFTSRSSFRVGGAAWTAYLLQLPSNVTDFLTEKNRREIYIRHVYLKVARKSISSRARVNLQANTLCQRVNAFCIIVNKKGR